MLSLRQARPMGRLRIDRLTSCPRRLLGPDGRVLADRCHVARSARARLIGLLGTPRLEVGEAVWLTPCSSVHTLGLRVAIGCALLDASGRIVALRDPCPPLRIVGSRRAVTVVECAPGLLGHLGVGERLSLGACPRTGRGRQRGKIERGQDAGGRDAAVHSPDRGRRSATTDSPRTAVDCGFETGC